MGYKKRWHVVAATVLMTVAACSSGHSQSASGAKAELSTSPGKALTISAGQMLDAADGRTPVAFGKPEHGSIAYGPNGAMIYTPDAGFSGTDRFHVTVTRSVRHYAGNLPPLATIGGVAIQANAFGAAITDVPGSNNEIYGLTDGGPSVDGPAPNQKILPLPDFHPQIAKLKLDDGVASVERTITLTGKDGAPMVGLAYPLPSGGESVIDLNGKPLPPSDHGFDGGGLVAAADGTFWVSDEYGPFIVHFDANGKELERLSPYDGTLPKELSLRSPGEGLAGLAITPDGSTLVGIMQSALATPGLVGNPKSVPLSRIVTVRLSNHSDVHEYLYPLANPEQTNVSVSDIAAISNTTFLVDEVDWEQQPTGIKKIYLADISGATDVGPRASVDGTTYRADAGGLLVTGVPIETLVGVSRVLTAIDKLKTAGISVVDKKLKLDVSDLLRSLSDIGSFFGHDKLAGVMSPDGGKTIVLANDSDFGLGGLANNTPPFALKPKILPNGAQDDGEVLAVDTTKLPPIMESETVSIKVG